MPRRVLVIEDDEEIADFLGRGLREEGFHVELAGDGRAGELALQSPGWDLVILDWWLPRQDGLQVLQSFRQRNQTTPVLFLTARDTVEQRVQGLRAGADDYLCKPFAFAELLARVEVLLRRAGTFCPLLQYQDLVMNLTTQRSERAGHALDLTAKEQALLLYFLQNAEKVLPRGEIYEQVWQEPYDGLTNTLEVHIMDLRRKLEVHGPRLIHTVRSRGYMLGEPRLLSPYEKP